MTVEGVRARLGDPEPEVRRLATQEIPQLPAPESCELLVLALADEDWRVRKEAAAIAVSVEPRTAVVFAVARALDEHENIGLRNAAVEALVAIGPDAVPGAVDALGRLDADGRKLAVEVLAGAPTLAGMRACARATTDPDPNVVVAAAEALGKADHAGDEARDLAIPRLVALLASPHPTAQIAALDALRALEAPPEWSALEPLLADPLVKRSALAAAGGILAPRAIRSLAEAVADENPTYSRAALVALGRSLEDGWSDDDLVDIAARTLRPSQAARSRLRTMARETSDDRARGAALLALGLVRDPDDVSLLADALGDDAVAERAEAALHLYGEDAVEPLLVAGRSAAPSLRGATLSMLPELATRDAEPLAAVREALGDPSSEVVAPALKSLAIVGSAADLEPVARLVYAADIKVAAAAQAALHAIALREPRAARALVDDLDPRSDAALAGAIAIAALAEAHAHRPEDVGLVSGALGHRDAVVRRAAIDALARLGGEDAALAVTGSLADEEAVVALAAIRALGTLHRAEQLALLAATTRDPLRLGTVLRALGEADPERAFAAARPLLRSPEASVAAAAIDVIGDIALAGRAEALLTATDHADQEVVKLALVQVAKLGGEQALTSLAAALEHHAEAVRRFAAELLGQSRRADEAETVLRARLDRERSAEVRQAIMAALAVRREGAA